MKTMHILAAFGCLLLASCGGSRSTGDASGNSADKLTKIDITVPLQEQVARLPGVYLNSQGQIRIRGSETPPLLVVDGAPAMGQDLTFLNPAEVESIEVLKGAEAAMYGTRAAGGVIKVATKRPPPVTDDSD